MIVLQAENIFFQHKNATTSQPVLNGVSLQVKKGELLAIQGSSGSGKSTLMYILGLMSKPLSGKITFFGNDIKKFKDQRLSRLRNEKIGFVFQQFHLLPNLSVLDNILLPVQFSHHKLENLEYRERALNLIRRLGLDGKENSKPSQLSGGQQQRVAICRALINNADIILADEPTGALDSQSSATVFEILRDLCHQDKKTVIIITHDNELALKCDRILKIKDGRVLEGEVKPIKEIQLEPLPSESRSAPSWTLRMRSAWRDLLRNRARSFLTMLGITVGVSATFSMITLGSFIKEQIMSGYAEMGIQSFYFYGYPNWNLKATDQVKTPYRYFNYEQDILSILKVFPEVTYISPSMRGWGGSVNYGGKTIDQDVRIIGHNEQVLGILNRPLFLGRYFTKIEVEKRNSVCVIGYEVAERLFVNRNPLNSIIKIGLDNRSQGCRIVGVFAPVKSRKEYSQPNLQIHIPFTVFQTLTDSYWARQLTEVLATSKPGSDVEAISNGIKSFFIKKYQKSGRFRVDSDSVLVAQMNRFLGLFAILLSGIALVILVVGGMGITNMMLVSLSERLREIGIKKALGATHQEIRTQFLYESFLLCLIGGLVGIAIGFGVCHLSIYAATHFVQNLQFDWTFNLGAFAVSVVSILFVGLLSGLYPAQKAQNLEVIEALRGD